MLTFAQMMAELNHDQKEAILRKVARAETGDETVAEKVLRGVISGDLRIVLVDGVKLVDHTGRGIPVSGMKSKVVDADRSFYLTQPEIDYAERTARLQEYYGSGMTFMPTAEFQERCLAVIERIKADRQISNLVKGPYFAWQIPQMQGDLGALLDDTIVPALERSYTAQFPDRKFKNYRHGELIGQVTVIPGTRQGRLIETMAKGPVCGVYFPALHGFGIEADREFIGHLPEYVILSGMEVPVVGTAYPGIIGRDWHTPGLDMAGLGWRSSEYSLYCEADGGGFYFDGGNLGVIEVYSGGLSVLG